MLVVLTGTAQQLNGTLRMGAIALPLVFHVADDKVTMDSPTQNAKDIPCEVRRLTADTLRIAVPAIGLSYDGRLQGDSIVGTFMQMTAGARLVLHRGKVEYNRPQTPQPKFPYTCKEVTFQSGDATLAGTLTYPVNYQKGQRVPVVLMVTGSGQQDRYETLMEHKPFLVLADYFAHHGIASLCYDDRGFAASTGCTDSLTTLTNMHDALAGIKLLRSLGPWKTVGVLGHSEGGVIGYMLGAEEKVDFVVSLAGPAEQGDSLIARQMYTMSKLSGAPVRKEDVVAGLDSIYQKGGPWLQYYMDFDPLTAISRLKIPTLALFGEKDVQVDAVVNRKLFDENTRRNPWAKSKIYPELNHLFQHCQTGLPTEYAQIEETISTDVLDEVTQWIHLASSIKKKTVIPTPKVKHRK